MKKGFTLIEILIVIAILMLLFLIVLASIRNQINKTYDVERKTDLNKIQKSLEEYYNDHQTYLTDAAPVSDCGSTVTVLSPYLSKIPCDPTTKNPYVYIVPSPPATAADGYVLCARLENQADPDIIRIGCDPAEGCGWMEGYNYCLTSGMQVTTTGYTPPVLTATPTPVPPTVTSAPTPTSGPLNYYACTPATEPPAGICNKYYDPYGPPPLGGGCPIAWPTGCPAGACADPANRCIY